MTSNIKDLIKSDEFEHALSNGIEFKKNIVTKYKKQNKDNFKFFSELMYESNSKINDILNKKKKNRTADDTAKLKEFKKQIALIYKQTQDLVCKEQVEEGKKTKVEKIVSKVIPVVKMLRYIGNTCLEDEFAKYGVTLNFASIESEYDNLSNENIKNNIVEAFNSAKTIKDSIIDDNLHITEDIFNEQVPTDLQFDKNTNRSGMKPADFKKLVDMKTMQQIAKSDEAKEKIDDKIEKAAADKQFEIARAELMRDSITSLQ